MVGWFQGDFHNLVSEILCFCSPLVRISVFSSEVSEDSADLASTSFCGFIVIYISDTVIRLPASSRSS